MVSGNRVFDPVSGYVYNERGEQLAGRWISYPDLMHPESVNKYYNLLSRAILDFWGEGSTELKLGKTGYELAGTKGDGREIRLNIGVMVVFLNQHGLDGLTKELERVLSQPEKK